MIIDKNSIAIDGVNLSSYLVEAKYGYNKLWASDAGRNLAGTQSGTLIGIFPKITLQFRKLTKSEIELLVPILDKAQQRTTYYDPFKQQKITIDTYSGDYEISNKNIITEMSKAEGFQISFISKKKRG